MNKSSRYMESLNSLRITKEVSDKSIDQALEGLDIDQNLIMNAVLGDPEAIEELNELLNK